MSEDLSDDEFDALFKAALDYDPVPDPKTKAKKSKGKKSKKSKDSKGSASKDKKPKFKENDPVVVRVKESPDKFDFIGWTVYSIDEDKATVIVKKSRFLRKPVFKTVSIEDLTSWQKEQPGLWVKMRKMNKVKQIFGVIALLIVLWLITRIITPGGIWQSAQQFWELFFPRFGVRGILVPFTNIIRWLLIAIMTVGFVWLLYRVVRSALKKESKTPKKREGDDRLDRVMNFKEFMRVWWHRWWAVVIVCLLGLGVVGVAAIPYRDVRVSNSYVICQEVLPPVDGVAVKITTVEGMESCANQLLILANGTQDEATKAHLKSSREAVQAEYLEYTSPGLLRSFTDLTTTLVLVALAFVIWGCILLRKKPVPEETESDDSDVSVDPGLGIVSSPPAT